MVVYSNEGFICHSVFLHCRLVIGCARKDALNDRKVCIFGAQRYVKGMYLGEKWVCIRYVFSQNR